MDMYKKILSNNVVSDIITRKIVQKISISESDSIHRNNLAVRGTRRLEGKVLNKGIRDKEQKVDNNAYGL